MFSLFSFGFSLCVQIKYSHSGMQDMTVDTIKLQILGKTMLAPMSTTDDKEVTLSYARSTCPLVFVYETLALI